MKRHLIYIICCLAGWQIQAQKSPHISPDISTDEDIVSYLNYEGNQSIVYTGREEAKYPNHILNHPYVDTNKYREGILGFDLSACKAMPEWEYRRTDNTFAGSTF